MINKFYPSPIRDEINDLMKKYEVCTDYYTIYSLDFIDMLTDYFYDKNIEVKIIIFSLWIFIL